MRKGIGFIVAICLFSIVQLVLCSPVFSAGKKVTAEERKQLYTIFNQNDLPAMKQLLNSGMDINADMGGGTTLLMKASNISTKDIVDFLVKKGADVNLTVSNGENALMMALSNSKHYYGIVSILLKAGIDVSAINTRNGYNPVWKISSKIKRGLPKEPGTKILQQLLSKGADPNARMISKNKKFSGMTPLMSFSQTGQKHIVEMLLAHGADPDLATKEGKKAVDFAKEKHHQDIVDFLSNWDITKKEDIKKSLLMESKSHSSGKDTIYINCKNEPRAPWCYQEAVEELGDSALCENILKYWPTAKGVHGWCYYRLAVLLNDCSLCDQVKKQDIKRTCLKDACRH